MASTPPLAPAPRTIEHPAQATHSETAILQHLSSHLPGWTYRDGKLRRAYRTGGWKGTAMLVGAIAHIAEAAWHHPELSVEYASVEVSLSTHSAGGITDLDFELAAKLDEVALWRPQGGALEGTPDDPRHRYVVRDSVVRDSVARDSGARGD